MSDAAETLNHKVRRSIPIVSVSGLVALICSIIALTVSVRGAQQRTDDLERNDVATCERGNDLRGELRDLAGRVSGGFEALAVIIVGDEERPPEQQARIDDALARYDAEVVNPIAEAANDDGPFAGRICTESPP